MIRVGIVGATGYTGYQLIKLLANHSGAEIAFATSQSSAGQKLSDLYPCPHDVRLVDPGSVWAAEGTLADRVDVVFFCLGHGESMAAVKQMRRAGVRAIDLSADFRLRDAAAYQQWYKHEHEAPELLPEAVYGLPEVYRQQIARAGLVANPGCYPTSILLALRPLIQGGHLASERIIADSKSGVSGAGRRPSLTTHFVEVNENLTPYNVGRVHRHLSEIDQELAAWAGTPLRVTFSPHLLPVSQGILSTIYVTLKPGWSAARLVELYAGAYAGEPFVHVLPPGRLASLAHVVQTNRCVLSFAEAGGDDWIVVSAIDNLIKGASGQAVQNMNLMFGLEETMGLPR